MLIPVILIAIRIFMGIVIVNAVIMVYRWNSKHDSSKNLLDNQYARRSSISAITRYIGAYDTKFWNRHLPHNFDYFSELP